MLPHSPRRLAAAPLVLALLVSLLPCRPLPAQETSPHPLEGIWQGRLAMPGTSLRIAIHLRRGGDGWTATLDSIDQGAHDIPVAETRVEGRRVTLSLPDLRARFAGELDEKGERIAGEWNQGATLPLVLERVSEVARLARPQEPVGPFPYRSVEVRIPHRPGGGETEVVLAGTLTLPPGEGPHPAAVLVSGSGPQNRDEELLGHKPFLVIADHLSRLGVAVLRYDDRGVGDSTGDFEKATSLDFADDAAAALRFLRSRPEIDGAAVGVVGHSEGGLIAPLVPERAPEVAFLVLLAGPGVDGRSILGRQTRLMTVAEGVAPPLADTVAEFQAGILALLDVEDRSRREEALLELVEKSGKNLDDTLRGNLGIDEAGARASLAAFDTPWMRFFVRHDPGPALERTRVPVLAMNGARDLQVDAAQNLPAIAAALERGGCQDWTIVKIPGLNHLFQTCDSGRPSRYAAIEETFAPRALELLSRWILDRFPPRASKD